MASRANLDQSRGELESALAEDAFALRTLIQLGDVCLKAKDASRALFAYARAAWIYEVQGFALKAVAVHKQMERVDPRASERRRDLARLYGELGLAADRAEQLKMLARAVPAQARAVLDELADDDDAQWREGLAALLKAGAWGTLHVVNRPYSLREVLAGHRATALAFARRVGGTVDIDVGALPSSRPVVLAPFLWAAGPVGRGVVVPRGGGRFEVETNPVEALRCVLAEAMPTSLDPWLLLRVFAALGGKPLTTGEPPHLEGTAAVIGVEIAGRTSRLRVDAQSLGVDVAPQEPPRRQ